MLPVIERATAKPFPLERALPEPDRFAAWVAQREWFRNWLDEEPAAGAADVAGLTGWIDLIRRFSFGR